MHREARKKAGIEPCDRLVMELPVAATWPDGKVTIAVIRVYCGRWNGSTARLYFLRLARSSIGRTKSAEIGRL